jgi:endonuclease-3 related protein
LRSSKLPLIELYERLFDYYGPQGWWPVDIDYHLKHGTDPREEIVIGAVLTQNTAWKNVERALENLKRRSALSFKGIMELSTKKLENLIKPSGYYRQKAIRLKEVCGALSPVSKVETISREELLRIRGVGRETADAILLYAGSRLFFVIDAYTKRLIHRLYGVNGNYEELRKLFEDSLPRELNLYKEFHALIDRHAKVYCRKSPLCDKCFLKSICSYG